MIKCQRCDTTIVELDPDAVHRCGRCAALMFNEPKCEDPQCARMRRRILELEDEKIRILDAAKLLATGRPGHVWEALHRKVHAVGDWTTLRQYQKKMHDLREKLAALRVRYVRAIDWITIVIRLDSDSSDADREAWHRTVAAAEAAYKMGGRKAVEAVVTCRRSGSSVNKPSVEDK